MLAGVVESPVLLEVAAGDGCSEGEDCFGAVQSPSCSSDAEAASDQVPACSLGDAGRDRPAGFQGLVVMQELVLVSQIADACAGPGAPTAFQAGQPPPAA